MTKETKSANITRGRKPSLFLLVLFLAMTPAAVYCRENPECPQAARILAGAVRDSDISFAVVRVPAWSGPVRLKNGLVPEELKAYSKISTGLTLARLELEEKIRPARDMDEVLYISYLLSLVEGMSAPAFVWERGSTWLLGLESPFKSKTPPAREMMKRYKELGAEAFLSHENYFLIAGSGYAAICLSWPREKQKPGNLTSISPDFLADFKRLISWYGRQGNPEGPPEDREVFMKKIRDPLARSILNSL
jgi:hypothetical protein